MSGGEELLPFIFYRDGIRALHIPPRVPREEIEAFFDAMKVAGGGPMAHDDLTTLLWQANLQHIKIDSVPFEQTIYISSHRGQGGGGGDYSSGLYALAPGGDEIHAHLGQAAGTQGLHRDTFDDWDLPDTSVDVAQGYLELLPEMEYSLAHFRETWEEETRGGWTEQAPIFLRAMTEIDPSREMARAAVHSVVTWITGALNRLQLDEALRAAALLNELDPEQVHSEGDLAEALAQLDHPHLAEFLDEAEAEEHTRFAALAVALGKPAVDLTFSVMSKVSRTRPRAAACTALCYLCADEPGLLLPYLSDARGEAMLNLVFVLGQIGGPEVVDLLRLAAQHPEQRVRRQVVLSLGSAPIEMRVPLLLGTLDSTDTQILTGALQMLAREKGEAVVKGILARITASEFDLRTEDARWALFNALAEVADDSAIPALETMLHKGGWFARKSFMRSAAARTLSRIGTATARAALQKGLKSRVGAVRAACQEYAHSRSDS